ncbi:MAG: phosphoadenosine phosphosulfate reductase family protein [Pseudomonadota bacterium]
MTDKAPSLAALIDAGAILYVSHSGGKDSQAMYLRLSEIAPADQIVVVHADLGDVEWRDVKDHIRQTIDHELHVVSAAKTFFEMVRRRAASRPDVPPWPSASTRQCTSDLKRGPIQKFIRADMRARGASLAVNCIGLRAEESRARARRSTLTRNAALSRAGREVYDALPIHEMTEADVFGAIAEAGQDPFHAYARNRRLSCVFCILGCREDLRHGAETRPDLYRDYLDLEAETGWTMFADGSLRDRVGFDPAPKPRKAAHVR